MNKKGFHHKCTNPWSFLSSKSCDQTMNLTGAEEVNQEQLFLVAFHITSPDWPLWSGAPPAAIFNHVPTCVTLMCWLSGFETFMGIPVTTGLFVLYPNSSTCRSSRMSNQACSHGSCSIQRLSWKQIPIRKWKWGIYMSHQAFKSCIVFLLVLGHLA